MPLKREATPSELLTIKVMRRQGETWDMIAACLRVSPSWARDTAFATGIEAKKSKQYLGKR